MTEGSFSSNHKRPNPRHFYAYQKNGVFQSGLKVDYVRLTNTVMRPREDEELDEDIRLIRTGLAKCKELFYLDTRSLPSLTLRISLSLACTTSMFTGITLFFSRNAAEEAGLAGNFLVLLMFCAFNFLQSLVTFGLFIFGLTWVTKQVYFALGITRFRVLTTIFHLIVSLLAFCGVVLLLAYLFRLAPNNALFGTTISILVCLIVFPASTTFLSSINIKNHPRVRIETEWRVNGRVYGEHLNQDNIPVLYPKKGCGFYSLDPMEYRTLIAYQMAQGDREQVKRLLNVWRTKPLVVDDDKRLFAIQNSNLLRKTGNVLFRITVSLLATGLELVENWINSKNFTAVIRSLKIRGINRVFWIYQECESALNLMTATCQISFDEKE